MIETKVLKIKVEELDESIKTEAVFDWKVKEKEWHNLMDVKYAIVYVLLALSIAVLTSAAVVRLFGNGLPYATVIIFSLLGLGFAIFVAAGLVFYLKIKKVQNTLPLYFEKRREYMLEMEKLRNHEKQD